MRDADALSLQGRAAFVMGGTTGIGRATAELLRARGAQVGVFGAGGSSPEDEIASQPGLQVFRGDGSVSAQVQEAIAQTVQAAGGLDMLVCAAAVHPYGTAVSTSEASWDRALAVNLKSMYLTAHHGVPHLLRRGGGAIVNVASNQGTACNPDVAAYAASKGAALAFTRSLAVDFGPQGVRANTVSPGPVDTPMLRAAAGQFGAGRGRDAVGIDAVGLDAVGLDAVYADWSQRLPLRRIACAEEIAELIVFLVSPQASFCTGADFVADGGLLAQLGF